MSQAIFPTLPGIVWPVGRKPVFSTQVNRAVSGKDTRFGFYAAPVWIRTLSFDEGRGGFLTQTHYDTIVAFFMSRLGALESFLFNDVLDNTATTENFGTGDGATTAFQLRRSLGGFYENVKDVNGTPSIYKNGTLQTVTTDYTIGSTGLVTFTAPPAVNAVLTWTGAYYWRVRFAQDQLDFEEFLSKLLELKTLELISVL